MFSKNNNVIATTYIFKNNSIKTVANVAFVTKSRPLCYNVSKISVNRRLFPLEAA